MSHQRICCCKDQCEDFGLLVFENKTFGTDPVFPTPTISFWITKKNEDGEPETYLLGKHEKDSLSWGGNLNCDKQSSFSVNLKGTLILPSKFNDTQTYEIDKTLFNYAALRNHNDKMKNLVDCGAYLNDSGQDLRQYDLVQNMYNTSMFTLYYPNRESTPVDIEVFPGTNSTYSSEMKVFFTDNLPKLGEGHTAFWSVAKDVPVSEASTILSPDTCGRNPVYDPDTHDIIFNYVSNYYSERRANGNICDRTQTESCRYSNKNPLEEEARIKLARFQVHPFTVYLVKLKTVSTEDQKQLVVPQHTIQIFTDTIEYTRPREMPINACGIPSSPVDEITDSGSPPFTSRNIIYRRTTASGDYPPAVGSPCDPDGASCRCNTWEDPWKLVPNGCVSDPPIESGCEEGNQNPIHGRVHYRYCWIKAEKNKSHTGYECCNPTAGCPGCVPIVYENNDWVYYTSTGLYGWQPDVTKDEIYLNGSTTNPVTLSEFTNWNVCGTIPSDTDTTTTNNIGCDGKDEIIRTRTTYSIHETKYLSWLTNCIGEQQVEFYTTLPNGGGSFLDPNYGFVRANTQRYCGCGAPRNCDYLPAPDKILRGTFIIPKSLSCPFSSDTTVVATHTETASYELYSPKWIETTVFEHNCLLFDSGSTSPPTTEATQQACNKNEFKINPPCNFATPMNLRTFGLLRLNAPNTPCWLYLKSVYGFTEVQEGPPFNYKYDLLTNIRLDEDYYVYSSLFIKTYVL